MAVTALRAREEDGEAAALPFVGLDGHTSPVRLRNALHDGEAETGAALIVVGPSVRVEDVVAGIRGDARDRVLDLELEIRARVQQPHDDTATGRRETDRIGAEVDHELVEGMSVADKREIRAIALTLQSETDQEETSAA
jgi:hypothetical protein